MSDQTQLAHPHPIPDILDCPSLNMLAGASGLGKTALMASLAVAFRDGTPIFGEQPNPVPAIAYICADRARSSARRWFTAAGFPDIPTYSLIDDTKFDLKQLHGGKHGPMLLEHCVDSLKLPAGSLLFVDPIALFLGGKLNDYTSVAIASAQIQRYLLQVGYCVTGVCHTSKLKADVSDRYARPQDRILGSTALLGYSSTQMYLMGPDESGREDGMYTFTWHPHHRPSMEFAFSRNPVTGLFNLDTAVKTTPGGVEVHTTTGLPVNTPQLDTVLGLIPPYPATISTADLVHYGPLADPPISRATLFRHLAQLQGYGKIHSPRKGLWQRVPTDVVSPPAPTDTPEKG